MDPETLVPTDKLDPLAAAWVKSVCGEDIETVTELLESKEWGKVKEKIDEGIGKANEVAVSNVAKVKKWKLMKKDFSVDGIYNILYVINTLH